MRFFSLWLIRIGAALGLGFATHYCYLEFLLPESKKSFLYELNYLWLLPCMTVFWLLIILTLTLSDKKIED